MTTTVPAEQATEALRPRQPERNGATSWRLRLGANLVPGGVEFRVWAPEADRINVQIDAMATALVRDDAGIWSGVVPGIAAGVRYRYRLDGEQTFPDPYSRSQPDGPHGPSQVVDPGSFEWRDAGWRGIGMRGLVIYELHVGTYTAEGTFDALVEQLDELQRLGVRAIELMPVAEFPGERNWGYDGVDLFAPSHVYGGPEGLKRLVDAAHARGLGVILDVVYNHFGPDGNYLLQYARDYLTDRHSTPWGDAVNFDGERSDMVRRFVVDNACYWLNEYHIDGLRLDATFAIRDDSPRHILEEIATTARAAAPAHRSVVLTAETYENDACYLRPAKDGGFGFDGVWADDFHHVAEANASHEHRGYYQDYEGTIEELARTIERGWLFEGQHSPHFGSPRGASSDGLPATGFVYCIQNHDQVGNRAFGRRFSHLAGSAMYRPWAALLLLLPYTPLMFMGQEFAASSRFYYFTDHRADLGRDVTKGRRAEFARTAGLTEQQMTQIPDPQAEQTFLESKLHLDERESGVGAQVYDMHRALLALRRSDPVLSWQDREGMRATAAGDVLLVHMWHGREHRLIVGNFGVALDAAPAQAGVPKHLASMRWRCVLSTEARRFGGTDDPIRFDQDLISLPPYTVAWLEAEEQSTVERAASLAGRTLRRVLAAGRRAIRPKGNR